MSSDKKGSWPVKVKKEIIDVIDEVMESPEGKQLGYSSRGRVVEAAIRELYNEKFKKRFEHINPSNMKEFDDKVRIMDNRKEW